MSKMFDNYDNQYNYCYNLCDCCHVDCPDIMLGWSGAEIIFDANGNEVGLGFTKDNPITLEFHFTGCVLDDFGEILDIDEFINNNIVKFELLNFRQQVIYTNEFKGCCEDQYMSLRLNREEVEKLVPEVYYIRLTILTENNDYVLFTPHDGLIHIS